LENKKSRGFETTVWEIKNAVRDKGTAQRISVMNGPN